jgi:hypothetical protein
VADYGAFQVGAAAEPITNSLANKLLLDADPALYHALSFFTYLINTYPGPRLVALAPGAGLLDNTGAAISAAVMQAYPWAPQPQQMGNQFKYPLLCVYRRTGMTGRFTASWEHDRGLFDLLYILPTLTPAQMLLVAPILRQVEATIRKKTTQGYDPGYTPPGGSLGGQVWGVAAAGVERVGFGDPYRDPAECSEYGHLPDSGEQWFPMLRMMGYFVERDTYTPAANKFTGADINANLVNTDGTSIPLFLQASTQMPPTLTGVSPGTGSHTGGTAITLTGTLYLQGGPNGPPQVLFGNTKATAVTWVSAMEITCTAPPVAGAGTVDVTVINADGQQVTAPQSFIYT